MKKRIAILGFTALAAIMPAACEGPAGPQGIQGEKGENGHKGEAGADGLSIVWQGELKTAPYPAYKNWAYYNNVDKKSYIYDGESWQILVKDGEAGRQGEKGDSLYLVIFNANGGIFAGGNETKNSGTEENRPIAVPEEPCWAWGSFLGWYTQPAGGSLFEFATPITAPITLYARWLFDKNLPAQWLKNQSGGDSEDDPLALSININLGDWQELLEAIEAAQKYVELDLSRCSMNGTVFNPGGGAGKDKIVSIILPNKATGIAAGISEATSAFSGFVNIRSFSGANLANIGAYAFYGRAKLESSSLPPSVSSIGNYAFYNCAKLNLSALPPGVTSIGSYAFVKCTEIALAELPSGIVSIDTYAFDGCSKLALTELPGGLTSISNYSFRNCKNLALTALPPGLTHIGSYAFSGCANLALTALPSAVKSILTNAFYNCSKLALTCLPETVTSIGTSTFNGCTGLTEMTLHEKITNIGNSAFSGCGSLKFFTCLAETPPTLGTGVFNNADSNIAIKVPSASVEAYKAAANWSAVANSISAIE